MVNPFPGENLISKRQKHLLVQTRHTGSISTNPYEDPDPKIPVSKPPHALTTQSPPPDHTHFLSLLTKHVHTHTHTPTTILSRSLSRVAIDNHHVADLPKFATRGPGGVSCPDIAETINPLTTNCLPP